MFIYLLILFSVFFSFLFFIFKAVLRLIKIYGKDPIMKIAKTGFLFFIFFFSLFGINVIFRFSNKNP
jgi:hypothetical protein